MWVLLYYALPLLPMGDSALDYRPFSKAVVFFSFPRSLSGGGEEAEEAFMPGQLSWTAPGPITLRPTNPISHHQQNTEKMAPQKPQIGHSGHS